MKTKYQLLSMALLSGGMAHANEDKQNVIVIYTDEHNFRTIEAYLPLLHESQRHPWGDNVPLETPNINFLAENGVIMNHCYVSTPVSTPSRSSMMTGMYTLKTNCMRNDMVLDRSLKTIGDCFSENGYVTGYFGKWHLSGDAKPGFGPQPNYGFQDNTYMQNRGHHKSIKDNPDGGKPTVITQESTVNDSYEYMTNFLGRKTREFVEKHKDEPFMTFLSIPDPHGPNVVKKEYFDMYSHMNFVKPTSANKNRDLYPNWSKGNITLTQYDMRAYWGMVKCIDDNIGLLLETLRTNNILDKTIIVFTSDHGDMCGEHGREDKSVPMEASMKVPFIVYAPNQLPKGHVVQSAVSNIDVYPTLADMCGLSGMPQVDGISILPLLKNEEGYEGRNIVFSRSTGEADGWMCVSTDRYKLVHSSVSTDAPWLLDQVLDPHELVNYYDSVSHKEVRATLTERLIQYCEDNGELKYQNNKIRVELGKEPIGGGSEPEQEDVDCPEEVVGNVLNNGNFEADGNFWNFTQDPKNPTSVNVGTNGVNSSHSLKLGISAKVTNCSASQPLVLEAGACYFFKGLCYYSASPTNGKKSRIRILNAADMSEIYRYDIPVNGYMGKEPPTNIVARCFKFTTPVSDVIISIENGGIDKLIRFDELAVFKNTSSGANGNSTLGNKIYMYNNQLILGTDVNVNSPIIYNAQGQLVSFNTQYANVLDISNLMSGIYVAHATTNNGEKITYKFTK